MNAVHLIEQVRYAGGIIRVEGGKLKLIAPRPLAPDLVETLRAHKAELLATLTGEGLREAFEERAAILEHDAGLSRPQAELEAARMIATKARNLGYTWTALRQSLSRCPELLAMIPDRPGLVDALPLGVSRFAVLPGRVVVKQGRSHGN